MDALSQERLNEILTKDVSELSAEDRGFLRARRDYLNSEEVSKYESVLSGDSQSSSDESSDNSVKLDRNALLAEAKELGIKGANRMKIEQVKAMVDNARFEAEAEAERKAAEEAEAKAKADAEAAEAEANKEGHKGNFSEATQEGAANAQE